MEPSHRSWQGEAGPFSPAMLGNVLGGDARPVYYVAGPQAMVSGVQVMLNSPQA